MLAVLSGGFDEAVKLALSGADLNERDATGRTALSLAIQMERRELALALLLIATAKFTRPLPGLLQPSQLQQLQVWLSTSGREKEAAMQAGLLRRQFGHSHGTGLADALIAASVQAAGATLATLNRRHFPMLANVLVPYAKGPTSPFDFFLPKKTLLPK